MKQMVIFIHGFLSAAFIFAQTSPQVKPNRPQSRTCVQAIVRFENYLSTLPTKCQTTLDCRARFLHINGCARPLILHKYYLPEFDQALMQITTTTRKSCAEEIANFPKCASQVVNPVCEEENCKLPIWVPVRISP